MLGCERHRIRMPISRTAVTGTPSFSLSIRTFFSATMRPVFFSRPRYTTP